MKKNRKEKGAFSTKTRFLLAMLAVTLAFGLVLAGCDDGGGDTTYTVTFDKNGGTSEASPATASTTTGGFVTLPAVNPGSPAGKQFGGWNTKTDGTGNEFTASTPVTASITVYAQWVDFSPTPALGSLADGSYEVNTLEDVTLRITVTNAAEIAADGGTLSYQWYKAPDETSGGTAIGTDSPDYTPAVDTAGTTYYWVVVTNSRGGQTATSNRAKIVISASPAPGDSTILGIVDLDPGLTGTVYAYEGTDLLGQAVLTREMPNPWGNAMYSWTITLSKPAMDGIAFVVGVNDASASGGELRSRKYVVEDLREWDRVILAEGYRVTGDYFHDGNGFFVVPRGSDEEIGDGEAWAGKPLSFFLDPKNPLSEFDPYPALTIEPHIDITEYQIVNGGTAGGDGKVARVDFVMPEHDIRVKVNFIPHYDPDNAAIKDGYYEVGYVLPLSTATQGSGVNLVLYGDGWKHSDLAVGGNWETAARDSLERFFALPVIRDFKAYFNVYALMAESSKTVQELSDLGQYELPLNLMTYLVRQMPQIRGKEAATTIFYIANGPAGGYMTEWDWFSIGVYSYGFDPEPQYCIFHEIMGHAFARLADEYEVGSANEEDIAYITVRQNEGFGLNCSLNNTRDTVPWKDFLKPDGSGITGYEDMGIFEGGFVYTNGVWRSIENSFMRDHQYDTSGWQRYLVYKRIMDQAGKPCTMADFFTYDAPNTLITDWTAEIAKTVTLP